MRPAMQIQGKPALLIGIRAEYCPNCHKVLSFDADGRPFCRDCHKRVRTIIEGRKIK